MSEVARRRPVLLAALVTLRPKQWVKNAFVAAPLVFSKHLFDSGFVAAAAIAVGVFCALSGAVYAFNDVRDVEQDRAHPSKCRRPIAAGELSERAALLLSLGLAAVALAAAAALEPMFALVAGGYLANNLAYSLKLKQIAYLDVLMIAGGFLLRVAGGAVAIGVEASLWLLACTALLACMLGFGKRAHELLVAAANKTDTDKLRNSLAGYSSGSLKTLMVVLAAATCAAYALYTQAPRTISVFGTRELIYTLPFCVIGIGRFLMLTFRGDRPESPTDRMLRDWPFMINLALWGAVVFFVIYGAR